MKFTVLGGNGGFPGPNGACSGYLIEEGGSRLLVDPGYAVLPKLQSIMPASAIDSVLVTHGHPDHCADLNPLLRARIMADEPAGSPLEIYALNGSVQKVIALDGPKMTEGAYNLHEFQAGDSFRISSFDISTFPLPHFVPTVGVRIASGKAVIAYTGDSGPSSNLLTLAHKSDIYVADATYVDEVDEEDQQSMSSAVIAGRNAELGGTRQLVLCHIWPGTDHEDLRKAASSEFKGPVHIAVPGLVLEI